MKLALWIQGSLLLHLDNDDKHIPLQFFQENRLQVPRQQNFYLQFFFSTNTKGNKFIKVQMPFHFDTFSIFSLSLASSHNLEIASK